MRSQRNALGLEFPHQSGQVGNGPGEPVDPGYDDGVTLSGEVDQRPQFGPPCGGGAGCLFGPDRLAAGGAQGGLLNGGVLVGGADAGVSEKGHGAGSVSH